MKISHPFAVLGAILALSAASSAARADLLDVSFDNGSNPAVGAAAVGTATDIFNNVNTEYTNNTYTLDDTITLNNTAGQPTNVTYTFSNTTEAYGVSEYGNSTLFPKLEAGNITGFGDSNFSFANLSADTSYTFYLYSTNDINGDNSPQTGNDFTLSNGSATVTLDQVANQSAFISTLTSTPGTYTGNYLAISGVTDDTGKITFTAGSVGAFNTSNGQGSYLLTGFQLETTPAAVPEPTTSAMLVAGLGFILALARRKRLV